MNCLLIALGGILMGIIMGYFANPMFGFIIAFSFVCPALHIALDNRQEARAEA